MKRRRIRKTTQKSTPRSKQEIDRGPREIQQHGDYRREAGRGGALRNMTGVPLDYYYNKTRNGERVITKRQHEAGERFWNDFMRSGLYSPTAPNFNADIIDGTTRSSPTERQAEAFQRWTKARAAISGRTAKVIVINVCCFGFMANDLLVDMQYYKRVDQIMPILKEGLDELAEFYGVPLYGY